MQLILIIKTGTTYPGIANRFGDFEDWIVTYAGLDKWMLMSLKYSRLKASLLKTIAQVGQTTDTRLLLKRFVDSIKSV